MDVSSGIVVLALIAYVAYVLGAWSGAHCVGWTSAREIESMLTRDLANIPALGSDPVALAAQIEMRLSAIHTWMIGRALVARSRGDRADAEAWARHARLLHESWLRAVVLMRCLEDARR